MKTLMLMRHAKSSWKDWDIDDHDRPLAKRGKKAAPLMGRYLFENGLLPEYIICSTAIRAVQTAKRLMKEIDEEIEIEYNKSLYFDGIQTIFNIICAIPDNYNRCMIVGHNPDIESLTGILTVQDFSYPKFSTAGIAEIEFDVPSWQDIQEHTGNLIYFKTPKMLYNNQEEL